MRTYLVFFGQNEQFFCEAEDRDHAIEQCLDAYPGTTILEVYVEAI